MHIDNELLENGRLLPLVEDFYTYRARVSYRKAAYFIRIGGCDIDATGAMPIYLEPQTLSSRKG